MLLKQLINPKPSIIFFFIIFCILFSALPILNSSVEILFSSSYIYAWLVFFIAITSPFFISVGLNNLVYEKNIIRKDNLVVGFVFVLMSTPFINTLDAWFCSFFFLFVLQYIIDSYQKTMPLSQFFNASIILSSTTIVYPNLIYFLILFAVSGVIYGNITWRLFASILLGLITPYMFFLIFSIVNESRFFLPNFFVFQNNMFFNTFKASHFSEIIWFIILALILIISFVELFQWLYKKSIKSRRTFMILVWFFIVSVLIAVTSSIEYFYFTLIPTAVIVGNFFVYTKYRKIADILFLLLLTSSLYYRYMIGINV